MGNEFAYDDDEVDTRSCFLKRRNMRIFWMLLTSMIIKPNFMRSTNMDNGIYNKQYGTGASSAISSMNGTFVIQYDKM